MSRKKPILPIEHCRGFVQHSLQKRGKPFSVFSLQFLYLFFYRKYDSEFCIQHCILCIFYSVHHLHTLVVLKHFLFIYFNLKKFSLLSELCLENQLKTNSNYVISENSLNLEKMCFLRDPWHVYDDYRVHCWQFILYQDW